MKHLKYFENNTDPQIGAYVICKESADIEDENVIYFTSTNIGQICDIVHSKYYIIYENVPDELIADFSSTYGLKNCRYMYRHEIIHFSSNKEDLEPYTQANKYNL